MRHLAWLTILCASGGAIAQAGQPAGPSGSGRASRELLSEPMRIPNGLHARPWGESRGCENYIYDNCPGAEYYFGYLDNQSFDTPVVPACGGTLVTCFYVEIIATTVPLTVTAELAPYEGTPPYMNSTRSVVIYTPGIWGVTFDLQPDSVVEISAALAEHGYIVVRQTYDQLDAGALLGEEAELGSNYDWLYWKGTYWWFGDNPRIAISTSLFTEGPPYSGACCNAGECFETDDYRTCVYTHGGRWFCFESCPEFSACPHLGACCDFNGCLGTMYEDECAQNHGTWFIDEECGTFECPPPPPNDDCQDVTPVVLAPGDSVTYLGDNRGATQDCQYTYYPEVWYAFTIAQSLTVTVEYCSTSPPFLVVNESLMFRDCPCTSPEQWLGPSDYCADGNLILHFTLPAGTWYYPVIQHPEGKGPFTITFSAGPPCGLECPPGATPEAEACQENYPEGTNGGCDVSPPAFEPIVGGEVLCGTLWAESSGRCDTDWYQLVTTEWTRFTWTVTAEVPVMAQIADRGWGCPGTMLSAAVALDCQPAVTSACAPPGTYWFWIRPMVFGDYPCEQVYYATLVCEPCIVDDYCEAGAYTCEEYISRVDLGKLSHSSECGLGSHGTPGYSDYTAMTVDLKSGRTYTLVVTNGYPFWPWDTCGAWIDWNDNYSLADAGEFYDLGVGTGPYFMDITVPYQPGPHRLRIRIDYAIGPDCCGIHDYGEVEDYTVNVPYLCADVNCDGDVNALDIDPFVQCLALGVPTPPCPNCTMADVNQDGVLNAFDIDPFVQCVINGG